MNRRRGDTGKEDNEAIPRVQNSNKRRKRNGKAEFEVSAMQRAINHNR